MTASQSSTFHQRSRQVSWGVRPRYVHQLPVGAPPSNVQGVAVDTPNAIPNQSVSGEPTRPDQGNSAAPGGPAGRITMALVPGSVPKPIDELQILLRRRLRFISRGIAAMYTVVSVINLHMCFVRPEVLSQY